MSAARARLKECQRLETVKALQQQKELEAIELERNRMDVRAERRQLTGRLHAERREAQSEDRIMRAKESHMLQKAQIQQEEKIAQELNKIKNEELLQLKKRQMIRESSIELKELEAQLRSAYVYKELCAQKAEKEAERMKEKLFDLETQEEFKRAVQKDLDVERKRQEELLRKQLEYRQQLQDQMIAAYKKRDSEFCDFLKEKQMIDEAVRKIHEEDMREFEQKMLMMEKTKKEMDDFKKARDEWRKKEKEAMELENQRLVEFLQKREERELERMKQLQEKEEKKAVLKSKLARKMFEDDLNRRERDEVLQILAEEDLRQAHIRREKEDIEHALRTRLDLRDAMRRQAREKADKLRREEEEEGRYRQMLLEQMMEKQRIDQLTAERQRVRRAELRREVEQLIAERRARREQEFQELRAAEEAREKLEVERRRMIEEERLRLLKEHAGKLIGYLPAGVLREDDLPHLGPELAQHYKELSKSSQPS